MQSYQLTGMVDDENTLYIDESSERGDAGNDVLSCSTASVADCPGADVRAEVLLRDTAGIQASH